MNKTIEDLRDEFYEKITVENHKSVIEMDDVKRLLEMMRDITIDWAIENARCIKESFNSGYTITDTEIATLNKSSLLPGKTAKELKI